MEDSLEPVSDEIYQYRPLNRAKREIRLIRIVNGDLVRQFVNSSSVLPDIMMQQLFHAAPIRCEIEHVSLDDKPTYIALSYMWGDECDKKRIAIGDGCEQSSFWITQNLHTALKHMSYYPHAHFWIDAVCINQTNLHEKSWQIQEMSTIFRDAGYIAAWIGPAADGSAQLFKKIEAMGKSRWETLHKAYQNGARFHEEVPIESLDENSFPELGSLAALIDRPYWRRAWVQQELQAGDVWLHCGSSRIHISHLAIVLKTLVTAKGRLSGCSLQTKSKSIRRSLNDLSWPSFVHVLHVCMRWLYGQKPLMEILMSEHLYTQQLKASDHRDLIFALLGMASDRTELGIIPSYFDSCFRVFLDTAIALIKRDVHLLTFVNCKISELRLAGLPSVIV